MVVPPALVACCLQACSEEVGVRLGLERVDKVKEGQVCFVGGGCDEEGGKG